MIELVSNPVYRSIWEFASGYFRQKDPDSTRIIDAAHDKGTRRRPEKHDIFVHHEFPFSAYAGPLPEEEITKYWQAIKNAFRMSENPFFITYRPSFIRPVYNDLLREIEIPAERRIGSHCEFMEVSGYLDPQYLQKLLDMLDGINPDDSYTLHGAALGCCPMEFARQLYGIVYASQFWHMIPGEAELAADDNGENFLHRNIGEIMIAYSLFEKSKIRLGVMHDSKKKLNILLDPKYNKPCSIQMFAPETHIIPHEKGDAFRRASAISFMPVTC